MASGVVLALQGKYSMLEDGNTAGLEDDSTKQDRCLHPPEHVKRGGNQHATWTVCSLCRKRLSNHNRPSLKREPLMCKKEKPEEGDASDRHQERPSAAALQRLEENGIRSTTIANRQYSQKCKLCGNYMQENQYISKDNIKTLNWCHTRCVLQLVINPAGRPAFPDATAAGSSSGSTATEELREAKREVSQIQQELLTVEEELKEAKQESACGVAECGRKVSMQDMVTAMEKMAKQVQEMRDSGQVIDPEVLQAAQVAMQVDPSIANDLENVQEMSAQMGLHRVRHGKKGTTPEDEERQRELVQRSQMEEKYAEAWNYAHVRETENQHLAETLRGMDQEAFGQASQMATTFRLQKEAIEKEYQEIRQQQELEDQMRTQMSREQLRHAATLAEEWATSSASESMGAWEAVQFPDHDPRSMRVPDSDEEALEIFKP